MLANVIGVAEDEDEEPLDSRLVFERSADKDRDLSEEGDFAADSCKAASLFWALYVFSILLRVRVRVRVRLPVPVHSEKREPLYS